MTYNITHRGSWVLIIGSMEPMSFLIEGSTTKANIMEIAELKQNVAELRNKLDALTCYDVRGAESLIKKYQRLAPMGEVGHLYASFSEMKSSKKD